MTYHISHRLRSGLGQSVDQLFTGLPCLADHDFRNEPTIICGVEVANSYEGLCVCVTLVLDFVYPVSLMRCQVHQVGP